MRVLFGKQANAPPDRTGIHSVGFANVNGGDSTESVVTKKLRNFGL
jgi:hypothetical protein